MKMIDTIVITLNRNQFTVLEPEKFTPHAMQVFDLTRSGYECGKRGFVSCTQSATAKEKRAGIYKPRLTLTKRRQGKKYVITLRVEFSGPKLLFGNNFDELTDRDFSALIKKLISVMADMGVKVSAHCLKKANISAIHYSKNIILGDYVSSSMILRELAQANITTRLDLNKTDYRNGGHSVKWHANSYEIACYDKVKDMQQARKSEKRAIEHDSAMQMDLFLKYVAPKSQEVLRIEIRLNTRKKLEDMLGQLNYTNSLTFKCLYSEGIARDMILHYWSLIVKGLSIIKLKTESPEDVYQSIAKNHPEYKPAKILKVLGLKTLIDSIGVLGAKSLFQGSNRSWQRLMQEIQQSTDNISNQWQTILQLEEKIIDFQLIKIQRS